jgi:hypothetical protein
VFDENRQPFFVAPGHTGVDAPATFMEVSSLQSAFFMARAQAAADVLVTPAFKLRFTAGFNYPGAQLFGIEAVYLFRTGR